MKTTRLLLPGFALLVVMAGCGRDVVVRGKVSYKGRDLNTGFLTFYPAAGDGKTFSIKGDGTYEATGLQPGKYTLVINTPKSAPITVPPPDGGKKVVKAGPDPVVVDDFYGKKETSKLEYEITAGSQELNITLPK
ncbi:MAG: hypothetical protein U0793_16320 [Gemmataceae bacterium]